MTEMKGILQYNGQEYPFVFQKGILSLLPPNAEAWQKEQHSLLSKLVNQKDDEQQTQQISSQTLSGKTHDNRDILFEVQEECSNDNGFISFNVYSVYVYRNSYDTMDVQNDKLTFIGHKNQIRGFKVRGREVNYVYQPNRIFTHILGFSPDQTQLNTITVQVKQATDIQCGQIRFNDQTIDMFVSCYATLHSEDTSPLSSKSEVVFEFQSPIEIETVKAILPAVYKFFCYLCRRKNIQFDAVEIFDINEKGLRNSFGELVYFPTDNEETHVQAAQRVIHFDYLENQFASLLQWFIDEVMYIDHLPATGFRYDTFNMDRIIFDYAAFERIHNQLFPEQQERSCEYNDVKNAVISSIDSLINQYSGKKKAYAKSMKRSIEHSGNSLRTRLKQSLKIHEINMKPFLIANYGNEYASKIDGACERLNNLRNDIAHGNLGISITADHIHDLRILEVLLYVMRLHKLNLQPVTIHKIINELFHYNLVIHDDLPDEFLIPTIQ